MFGHPHRMDINKVERPAEGIMLQQYLNISNLSKVHIILFNPSVTTSLSIMATLLLFLLINTMGKVNAGVTTKTYSPINADCIDCDILLSVATKGIDWLAPKWKDNSGLIDFVSLQSSRSSANFSSPVGGSIDTSGQYIISTTFCSPKKGAKSSGNVMLATHGLGYDKRQARLWQ